MKRFILSAAIATALGVLSPAAHADDLGGPARVDAALQAVAERGQAQDWYLLGFALARGGDAAAAALAFETLASVDPEFPDIADIIAAAHQRAEHDLQYRIERPGFRFDTAATEEAFDEAIARGDRIFAVRALALLQDGPRPVAEAALAGLDGNQPLVNELLSAGALATPDDPDALLEAAQRLHRAGERRLARRLAEHALRLGGDRLEISSFLRSLDADTPAGDRP